VDDLQGSAVFHRVGEKKQNLEILWYRKGMRIEEVHTTRAKRLEETKPLGQGSLFEEKKLLPLGQILSSA
jgi:hypothetical protein